MDLIHETPTKRRKTESGHISSGRAYDSQDDSGDDLFQGHETVATVPIPSKSSLPPSSPPSYITQPTQIIEKNTPNNIRKPSILQIAASSPVGPSTSAVNRPPRNGPALASLMAPAGTSFRPPMGVRKPAVIDLSDDDGPTYKGGPSDEESQQNQRDLKPSKFVHSKERPANGGISRFREIAAGAVYRPPSSVQSKGQTANLKGSVYDSRNRDDNQTTSQFAAKRSSDTMANAYGNARRPVKEQAAPAKATSMKVQDIALEDIEDYQLRAKVQRMRAIWPMHTIIQCKDALLTKKCNFDDAVDLLTSQEPQAATAVDLTISDDEDGRLSQPLSRKKKSEKAKATPQTIQERWTSTQVAKPTQEPGSSPLPVTEPPKQRKRLVQGRRRPTSPVPPPPVAPAPPRKQVDSEPQHSDSGIASGEEDDDDEEAQAEIEIKVLGFFNTCSIADLQDIAGITAPVATMILSHRPFASLRTIENINGNVSTATTKTSTKRPIGEKIVEKCIDMWTGYEAVDQLVKHCENLGKPVANEMKRWGVDVYGGSKNGELDMVTIEHLSPGRDSGIGTPTTSGHATDDDEGDLKKMMRKKPGSLSQPKIMSKDVELKDYQIVGVNWLSLLFEKELSCILADDMGLGKTCQVVAFLAHLKEKGVQGPHIVVVPASTLENWLREFSIFCPALEVMPFYAELKEREEVRQQISKNIKSIDVIVTTYGMARRKDETSFLRKLSPVVCVYDEGHTLKNSTSAGYKQLMRLTAKFRLLLTGTPLQNNLLELMSLLGFILPDVFNDHREKLSSIFNHKAKTTDDSHAALLSAQRIARAKAMMTPFILRRKKHQVLKHLPGKTRRVEYCEMSSAQLELYGAEKARAAKIIRDRAAGIKTGNESANIIMNLRKASIHPLLFRRLYTDTVLHKMSKACLKESEFAESNPNLVFEDMSVMTDHELHVFCETYPKTMSRYILPSDPDPDPCFDSGKITALTALLETYIANGDRVLIFSQFVLVLNLLVPVLESLGIEYSRLDGGTAIAERQPLIDDFTDSDPPIPVFLLSTKAGGAGINLACANKVIIFDSSFNPQDDIQAENRAHRVGQKREVEVVRFVSKGTVEEAILALGETKVALDERVAGVSGGEGEDDKKAEKEGLKRVEELVFDELKGEKKTEDETEKKSEQKAEKKTKEKTKSR